jgi:hypothetical protein
LAAGCSIDQICFPDYQDCPSEQETGGEEGELYCGPPRQDGTWVCVKNSQWDTRVKLAIQTGTLVPWTDVGSCPHKGREWDALQKVDPIVHYGPPLRAVECSWSPFKSTRDFICLSDRDAWGFGFPIGAIGVPDGSATSNCG